jgi:hypothetical protein
LGEQKFHTLNHQAPKNCKENQKLCDLRATSIRLSAGIHGKTGEG